MRNEVIVGWDIGGAHLKAAVVDNTGAVLDVRQQPCPLWKGVSYLDEAVGSMLHKIRRQAVCHAITMTGELVDFFATRHEGVKAIIKVMSEHVPAHRLHFFVGPDGAFKTQVNDFDLTGVASANWLASALFSASVMDSGLFIDVGSTTTDLLLFDDRRVLAHGYTDYDRLRTQELVYTGVVRTPVMAVTDRVPFAGDWVDLMAEYFATMSDVYRLCGDLPEYADQMQTADGGEKTPAGSARRLARMLGRDVQSTGLESLQQLARYVREQQLMKLFSACHRHLSRGLLADDAALVGAGAGRFLIKTLAVRLGRPYRDFSSLCNGGPRRGQSALTISDCAPAVAVARLLIRHQCS